MTLESRPERNPSIWRKRVVLLLVALASTCGYHAGFAAAFRNLDFEAPVGPLTPGFVPTTNALPGWRAFAGDIELQEVVYNGFALSGAQASLLTFDGVSTPDPIEGSFSAYLYSGLVYTTPPAPGPASLRQVGLVPSESRSLQFKSGWELPQVSLGGSLLPLFMLSQGTNYALYGADITAYAGQELELRFTAPVDPTRINGRTDSLIDSIEFSTTVVPEPSAWTLLGAVGVIGWCCWRRRQNETR